MGNDHESTSNTTRLCIEHRIEFEEVSPQWLYSYQEAQDLVRHLHAILRDFEMQYAATTTLIQGYIEERPDFLAGCVSVQLQIYPANSIRVTRRVSTLVFSDGAKLEGCSY